MRPPASDSLATKPTSREVFTVKASSTTALVAPAAGELGADWPGRRSANARQSRPASKGWTSAGDSREQYVVDGVFFMVLGGSLA